MVGGLGLAFSLRFPCDFPYSYPGFPFGFPYNYLKFPFGFPSASLNFLSLSFHFAGCRWVSLCVSIAVLWVSLGVAVGVTECRGGCRWVSLWVSLRAPPSLFPFISLHFLHFPFISLCVAGCRCGRRWVFCGCRWASLGVAVGVAGCRCGCRCGCR